MNAGTVHKDGHTWYLGSAEPGAPGPGDIGVFRYRWGTEEIMSIQGTWGGAWVGRWPTSAELAAYQLGQKESQP